MAFTTRWPKPKIRPVSERMKLKLKEYAKVKRKYLKAHPVCECEGCDWKSNDIHHKRGRTGSLLSDERYFMAMCRLHHDWCHQWPDQARRHGWTAPVGQWGKADK